MGELVGIREHTFSVLLVCRQRVSDCHHPDGKQLEPQDGDWELFNVRLFRDAPPPSNNGTFHQNPVTMVAF